MGISRENLKKWATITACLSPFAFIASSLFDGFIQAYAQEQGWYDKPGAKVNFVISLIKDAFSNPWSHWIVGGLIGFAAGVWLDAILKSNEKTLDGNKMPASADENTNLSQQRILLDTPIHQAIDYVATRLDDSDTANANPIARHALRAAAHAGRVTLHGKKRSNGAESPSKLRTAIPKEFWDDQQLTAYATVSSHEHWIHTEPEKNSEGKEIGVAREQYWEVRVSFDEIKKQWS